jgi:predicted solute-binding protein
MKRIFSFLTVLVFTFAMFACNSNTDTAAENAEEQMEEAAEDVEEAAEEAADEVDQEVEEAVDTVNNEM